MKTKKKQMSLLQALREGRDALIQYSGGVDKERIPAMKAAATRLSAAITVEKNRRKVQKKITEIDSPRDV